MSEKLSPVQLLVAAQSRIAELETQVNASAPLHAETVSQLGLVTAERDKLTGELATASARIEELVSAQSTAKTDNDAEVARLAGIKAQEVLASTGVAPVAAAPVNAAVTTEELWAAYQQIPNIYEKTRFYQKHEKVMSKASAFLKR